MRKFLFLGTSYEAMFCQLSPEKCITDKKESGRGTAMWLKPLNVCPVKKNYRIYTWVVLKANKSSCPRQRVINALFTNA